MSEDFATRVVLVTGASRGIGAAIADAFARNGAQVFGTATSEGGAASVDARLRELQPRSGGLQLDVKEAESIDRAIAEITDRAGAPLILVNNAGITRDQLLMRMKDEDWDLVMNTNLRSVYRLSKTCLRAMLKARFGRIINISSVVGATGNPGQANYAAAKAGMEGFTRSLAREVATRGVTVNVVAPGFIDTDMTRALPENQREALLGSIPMQRLGNADEIAAAVTFLAGDAAGYITGQTIHVNGGMYMG